MDTDESTHAPDQPDEIGWHADPFGRFERRWWDGNRWSEKVSSEGKKALDPPGINTAPHQFEIDEPAPAEPITDATLPIKPPSPWSQLSYALGIIVFVAMVVLVALVALGILSS